MNKFFKVAIALVTTTLILNSCGSRQGADVQTPDQSLEATAPKNPIPKFQTLAFQPTTTSVVQSGSTVVNLVFSAFPATTSSTTYTLSGLPTGVAASLTTFTVPKGVTSRSFSITLTANESVVVGNYVLKAGSASLNLSVTASVIAKPSFSVSATGMNRGGSKTVSLVFSASSATTVDSSYALSGLPTGVSSSEESFFIPKGTTSKTFNITFTAYAGAKTGFYDVKVGSASVRLGVFPENSRNGGYIPQTIAVGGVIGGYSNQSLAIKPDGTVAAWGNNIDSEGQPVNVPSGLNNVVAISSGKSDIGGVHNLALKSDGTVVGWGYNGYGQATPPPTGLNNVVSISAGTHHSLALKSDGTVVAWGWMYSSTTNLSEPVTVPSGLNNVVAIAAGNSFNLALKNDGTVVAWGYNGNGETDIPTGLNNVVAISAGYFHSLALKSDGTVVAWGNNGYGQSNVPFGLKDVVAISAGGEFSLALKNDGTIVGWGSNGGQISGLNDVVAIAAGYNQWLALRTNGSLVSAQWINTPLTVPDGLVVRLP